MDVREAIYTTRAMRRIEMDRPIPAAVQARILDAAIRVPNVRNDQSWRFVIVDDVDVLAQLGAIYRSTMESYRSTQAARSDDAAPAQTDAHARMMRSALYLANNFEKYPLVIFGATKDDPQSVGLAMWNALLAARAEGVGGVFTRMIDKLPQTSEVLGIPRDEGWQIAASAVFGYPTGRWGVAERRPVESVSFSNRWERPLSISVNGPLYP